MAFNSETILALKSYFFGSFKVGYNSDFRYECKRKSSSVNQMYTKLGVKGKKKLLTHWMAFNPVLRSCEEKDQIGLAGVWSFLQPAATASEFPDKVIYSRFTQFLEIDSLFQVA